MDINDFTMEIEYFTRELQAVSELRRLVYYLSENVEVRDLWPVRAKIGIEHLAIKGDNRKQVIVNLMIECQKQHLLQEFIEGLISCKIIGQDLIDLDVFDECDYEIPNIELLSFNVSHKYSCIVKDTEDDSLHHTPSIIRVPDETRKCKFNEYCCICGEKIGTTIEHYWSKWEYVEEHSCQQQRTCSRCGETETRLHHMWSNWIANENDSKYRICSHCNKEEFDVDGEWWGYVYWENEIVDLWNVEIRTSWLLGIQKAEVTVYVNVHDENQCDGTVTQKASVTVNNNEITIKCKKVTSSTRNIRDYRLDSFDGIIGHKCQTIEGIVYDGHNKGILLLNFNRK